jgi:hypothetical protein
LHFGSGAIDINNWLINKWFLYGLIIIVSWLMVSNLPVMAFKFKNFSLKNSLPQLILIAIEIISVWLLNWTGLAITLIAFIISFFVFKKKPNNLPQFILILISIVSVILLHWLAVPIIFIAYIILSLIYKNKTTP